MRVHESACGRQGVEGHQRRARLTIGDIVKLKYKSCNGSKKPIQLKLEWKSREEWEEKVPALVEYLAEASEKMFRQQNEEAGIPWDG